MRAKDSLHQSSPDQDTELYLMERRLSADAPDKMATAAAYTAKNVADRNEGQYPR